MALITGEARAGRYRRVRHLQATLKAVLYTMATPKELDETARLVKHLRRRCLAFEADVGLERTR